MIINFVKKSCWNYFYKGWTNAKTMRYIIRILCYIITPVLVHRIYPSFSIAFNAADIDIPFPNTGCHRSPTFSSRLEKFSIVNISGVS